jgi:hypothetical protein
MIVTINLGSSGKRHGSGQTRVVGGKFSISWPQALDLGSIYEQLAVLFDADGDGRCAPGEQYLRYTTLSCIPPGPAVFSISRRAGSSAFVLRVADDAYCQTSFNAFATCPADDGGAP